MRQSSLVWENNLCTGRNKTENESNIKHLNQELSVILQPLQECRKYEINVPIVPGIMCLNGLGILMPDKASNFTTEANSVSNSLKSYESTQKGCEGRKQTP